MPLDLQKTPLHATGHTLRLELTMIITIKLIALTALWYFIIQPQVHRVNDAQMEHHFIQDLNH